MADLTKDELKAIFKAGAIPTEAQFASLIESQINKKDTGSLILSASSIDISGSAIAKTDIDLLKQGKSISSPTIASGSTSAEDNINYTQYLRPEAVISDSDTSTYTKYTTPGRMGTFVSGTLFFDLNQSSSNNYIALGATNTQLRLTGNITSSGNISASGTIIANSIIGTSTTFTNVTASGAISASGNLIVGGTSALNGDITIPKLVKLYFGGTSGMHVYSEGTATDENQIILAKTNNLRILNQAHGKDIIFGTENASGTAKTPLTLSGSGDALFGGNVLANGFQYVTSPNILTLHSTLSSTPQLHLRCDENGAVGPKILLEHSSSSPAANDVISTIGFIGRDDAGNSTTYAQIHSTIVDPANGSEGGKLSLAVASHNGSVINGIVIEDGGASSTTNVTVGSGATSNIIIPGNVSSSGNILTNNITASGAISASRIDTTGTLDLNAGDNITLDAADDIVLTTTSADGEIQIVSAHTAGVAFHLDANADAASEVQIDAGVLDIDVTAAATIDAVGVAIGAGSGELDLTTTSTMDINSAALDIDASAAVTIDSVGLSIDNAGVAANITSTTDGAAEDFTIALAGATDSSLILSSTGTGADALQISTSAGSLDIDSADNITVDAADDIVLTTTSADGEIQIVSAHTAGRALFIDANAAVTSEVDIDAGTLDIDSAGNTTIDAGGSIGLTAASTASISSTLNAGASILLHANGGTSETIKIHSDQGTSVTEGAASVSLLSDAGGVELRSTANLANAINITNDGGTTGTITIFNDQGTSTTEGAASVQLLSDAGGIGIKSTADSAAAIRITADGGTNETILIHADQGTSADSILISSDVGGIMLSGIKGVKSKIANGIIAGGGIDAATTEIQIGKYNGEIVTTIHIDIGAGSIVSGTDTGDVIGEEGVANAYVTQITTAKNGIVYKGEIVCLEVPTTGDPDINVAANSSGTIAEDAGGEGQHVLANCGTHTLALKTDFTIPAGGIQDDFIYLTHGGTTAGTYNAGKFYIRFYGVSPLGL